MALAASSRRNNYTGNNSASSFDYDFRIFDEDYLEVFVVDSDDVRTDLVLDTDYSVAGAGSVDGGSITLVDANQDWLHTNGNLKTGYDLFILGATPVTQPSSYKNQGNYYAKNHENSFDRVTMIAQEISEALEGAIRLPDNVDPDDFDPTLPTDIESGAGKVLVVNDDGDGLELGPTASELLDVASDAAASAAAAASSASAASTSASSASSSASDAAASAVEAAASAALAMAQSGPYTATASQSATNVGESLDSSTFSTCSYFVEIYRAGAFSSKLFFEAYRSGSAWAIEIDRWIGATPDLTFTYSSDALQVAETAGTDATFKIKKIPFTI